MNVLRSQLPRTATSFTTRQILCANVRSPLRTTLESSSSATRTTSSRCQPQSFYSTTSPKPSKPASTANFTTVTTTTKAAAASVPAPPPSVSVQQAASSSTVVAATPAKKQSRFRQYADQFKNKPASHLISFGILHEVTAVVPLAIVYFALDQTGVQIPFPEQAMEQGTLYMTKLVKHYGWNTEGADGARMMLNLATSYAIVKALMPLRLAMCVWMTPWTATRIISPVMNFWKRFKK